VEPPLDKVHEPSFHARDKRPVSWLVTVLLLVYAIPGA
jgi:hypothetical protein